MLKQLFGKNKNKPVKIYKGYNSEWFNSIAPFDFSEVNIPKDAIKVAYVGNHRKVKGTKYFLESSYHLTSTKETENATTFQGVLEHYKEFNPEILGVVRRKRGFFTKMWEKNSILKRDFYVTTFPVLVLSGLK